MPEPPDSRLFELEAARVAIIRSFLEGSLDANQATARLLALDLEARSRRAAEVSVVRAVDGPYDAASGVRAAEGRPRERSVPPIPARRN